VPSWVHPAWLVCAGLLSLVLARKVVGLRWTATAIAATYLAYRAVMWGGLVAMGFPPSVLPVVLLVGAFLIDIAVTRRVPGWAAGIVVTAAVYAAAVPQEWFGLLPPWNWWSALPVAVGFALLWGGVDALVRSRRLAHWQAADEPAADAVPPRG
jgi:hypothetical protein